MGQLAPYSTLSSYVVFGGYPIDEFSQCLYISAGPDGAPEGVGKMTITSVMNTYRPNVYVKDNESVSSDVTSIVVDGLDPATNYYATVKTLNGTQVSDPSDILHLDSLVPTILTGATAVSGDSYTANWQANTKASSYVVTNYEMIYAEGSCPIAEDGSKCIGGTFDEPTTVDSFDEYTASKGWVGATCLVADGMFGVADGAFRGGRPIGGYLYSPEADFSANNGKIAIDVTLYGNPGDVINVFAGSYSTDKVHPVTIPESGVVTEQFDIIGGTENTQLKFESTTLKKFFIKSLTASQGEKKQIVLLEDSFDKATSGTFDSPQERIQPDDYTAMPGWNVNSAIIAKGMFGTYNGMIISGRPYGGGAMTTPELGFSKGDVYVSFRLQSSKPSEDEITIYVGSYDPATAKTLSVPADGIIDETVLLSSTGESASVYFESKLRQKFMLDDIKIYQTLAPGQKVAMKLSSAEVTEGTSHTFSGLDASTRYGYSVRTDYLNFFDMPTEGSESAIMEVAGSTSGIDSVTSASENTSPVISVILTDLTGRRVLAPASGSIVIRTEIHADGSCTNSKIIMR